ncbi:PIR protein, putative [Plasmodium sp.]|nr:PIR protein, putative [Plasmodium sp.]
MKVLYINILLFALPLNILVDYPKNTYITLHTPITTSRLLCECDIYNSMYDNDPEMKAVIENYNRQTSDRFKEYDERMQYKRQKCKEQCDKEIQKIVLKDKLEKELTQKFSTLETNIDTNDIPTCVCKKSLADKTEKFCLNCGLGIGSGLLQASSLLGGIGEVALDAWKTAALVTAEELAEKAGAAAGKAALIPEGIKEVISGLKAAFPIEKLRFGSFNSLINEKNYANAELISYAINIQYEGACKLRTFGDGFDTSICDSFGRLSLSEGKGVGYNLTTQDSIKKTVEVVISEAKSAAAAESTKVATEKTALFKETNMATVEGVFNSNITAINASIIAILIIVLVMVIIYLILRYRRKKKMMKKLQYIKLLKE